MNPNDSSLVTDDERVATLVAPARGDVQERASSTALMHCLIVSTSTAHLDWLSTAAQCEGWSTMKVRCTVDALREAIRQRFQLAVIDLTAMVPGSPLEPLVADLQAGHVPLVVVCGETDNDGMEIRVRKLGVWSYVSGVDLSSDLQSLFAEARDAARKIDPTLHAWQSLAQRS